MAGTLNKLLIYAPTYSDRTAKNLTRFAITNTSSLTFDAQDVKNYMQVTKAAYSSSLASHLKPSQSNKSSSFKPLIELGAESNRIHTSASLSDSKKELSRKLQSLLCGDSSDSEETYIDVEPLSHFLDIPWRPITFRDTTSMHRKEILRLRKKNWVFNSTQYNRYAKLAKMCTHNLGENSAIEVLGKSGRDQLGVKQYNAMIEACIEKARNTDDEAIALKEFRSSYRVFESMRERGFEIGEQTYGPFLMFIIDMRMVDEFYFFCENFKKENPNSISRLAYYEMLLWIKVNDGDKIKMLIANTQCNDECKFNEGYLVALCEWDRQEEVSMLLETIDIKKVSSKENMERIFKLLGRLSLESHAKNFILQLKTDRQGGNDLSNLIYTYAMSIPNIQIEESFIKFKNLQAELKVSSSSVPYEKLIKSYFDLLEVSMKTEITWVRDMLRGDDAFKLQVKLLKQVPEEYTYKDDE